MGTIENSTEPKPYWEHSPEQRLETVDFSDLPGFIEKCREFRRSDAPAEEKVRVKHLQMQAMNALESWRPPPMPLAEPPAREDEKPAFKGGPLMGFELGEDDATPTYPPSVVTTISPPPLAVVPWWKQVWLWFVGLFR